MFFEEEDLSEDAMSNIKRRMLSAGSFAELMKIKGKNKEEMAEILGVPVSEVEKYIKAKKEIPYEIWFFLHRLWDINLNYFIVNNFEEEMFMTRNTQTKINNKNAC